MNVDSGDGYAERRKPPWSSPEILKAKRWQDPRTDAVRSASKHVNWR